MHVYACKCRWHVMRISLAHWPTLAHLPNSLLFITTQVITFLRPGASSLLQSAWGATLIFLRTQACYKVHEASRLSDVPGIVLLQSAWGRNRPEGHDPKVLMWSPNQLLSRPSVKTLQGILSDHMLMSDTYSHTISSHAPFTAYTMCIPAMSYNAT